MPTHEKRLLKLLLKQIQTNSCKRELQAASVQSKVATGERRGQPVRRLGSLGLVLVEDPVTQGPLGAAIQGFSLHAGVYLVDFYHSNPSGMIAMRRNAMMKDYSWNHRVGEYEELFELLRLGYPERVLGLIPRNAPRPSIKEAIRLLRGPQDNCAGEIIRALKAVIK